MEEEYPFVLDEGYNSDLYYDYDIYDLEFHEEDENANLSS